LIGTGLSSASVDGVQCYTILCYSQSVQLSVDDLARVGGTSSRNVRALQTAGLLPGPSLLGRTGAYDESHLVRLQAVLRLQARGFSRAAIRELFAAWEDGLSLEDILGVPPRGDHRGDTSNPFDALADSLPTWRGPSGGLLPGPLAEVVSSN
jgi:DNA-binding transcriptional MerR regulator